MGNEVNIGTLARVWMKLDHKMVTDGYSTWKREVRKVVPAVRADVVTSLLRHQKGMHAPALDLDVPHTLIPSSTPGHSHLYIDVPMSWWRYKRLLKALAKAGIIEKGFVKASIARGHTDLRVPWKGKNDG